MLAYGWALTSAIDITRCLDDKSVLLYTRAQNFTTTFACIALSDEHRLGLLDFPPSHMETLREVLARAYLPGITSQEQRDNGCYEMDLEGYPWTACSVFNLHGRCFACILISVH